MTRDAVLAALRAEIAAGRPLIMAGVGTGLTARSALDGGADLLVAYHSAPLRLAGLPSAAGLLPLARADALVEEMAEPILHAAAGAPVLATAYAADPATSLQALRERGFAGVLSAPTATLIDGAFREELERAGLGFRAELRLLRSARAFDLIACAYATTREEAQAAADAGADVVVAHLGITRDHGDDGELDRLAAIAQGTRGRPALVLCHGGSLSSPAATQAALSACPDVVGWFGASAIERLPIERAVREATAAFKHANPAGLALDGTP